MEDIRDAIQKKIDEVWPGAQKQISKISKDALKSLKKSKKQLELAYGQTKKAAQEIAFKTKREQLYYELGKAVAPTLRSGCLKNKKVKSIYSEIQRLNKKLRSK